MTTEIKRQMREKSGIMTISEHEQAMENFKAFYYQINAKPDCKSIIYSKNIRIDKEDIIELSNRIVDKFQNHYDEEGYKINVHLSFYNRKIVEFSTWESFVEYVWPTTKLNSITLEWEYFLKLPGYQYPQLHRLIVKISDGIRPEEMLNLLISGRLEEIDELEKSVYPLAARVDFVNNVISDELLQIVREWADGVRLVNKNRKFLFKLRAVRRQVAYFLNYITTFVSLICGMIYFNTILFNSTAKINELSTNDIRNVINILFVFFVIVFAIYKISELISNYIFKSLEDFGENHVFNITKDDKKVIESIENDEEKRKKHIILNFILSILINITCGIITSMLI
ncbi:hypothetical protein [uncultured Thomasclavelia sp.]|uniref:hypothetical protein n=1 Tax=uncultured Thomasclavelia sp. TaxID=3025759 RepID=UPI002604C36E|nr:hypothetical protein [uncultured Thomasclavelia sp.]